MGLAQLNEREMVWRRLGTRAGPRTGGPSELEYGWAWQRKAAIDALRYCCDDDDLIAAIGSVEADSDASRSTVRKPSSSPKRHGCSPSTQPAGSPRRGRCRTHPQLPIGVRHSKRNRFASQNSRAEEARLFGRRFD